MARAEQQSDRNFSADSKSNTDDAESLAGLMEQSEVVELFDEAASAVSASGSATRFSNRQSVIDANSGRPHWRPRHVRAHRQRHLAAGSATCPVARFLTCPATLGDAPGNARLTGSTRAG